jgi:hypothetical protein
MLMAFGDIMLWEFFDDMDIDDYNEFCEYHNMLMFMPANIKRINKWWNGKRRQ